MGAPLVPDTTSNEYTFAIPGLTPVNVQNFGSFIVIDYAPGPLQVFARASDMHCRENPGARPIYVVEVISVSGSRSLTANCGLRFSANKTFRQVRGKIDTLLI